MAPVAFPSVFYYEIGASIFIAALAVVGLNLLMGFAGQVSLGHAGFWGLGAYAVAIGPTHLGIPPLVSLLAGLLLTMLVAWLVGRPILKLRGHYLAVATLGFGFLVTMVLTNEARWTGGPDGMGVPRLDILGFVIRGSRMWYWTSAGRAARRHLAGAQPRRQPHGTRAAGAARLAGGGRRQRRGRRALQAHRFHDLRGICQPSRLDGRVLRRPHHADLGRLPALDRAGDHERAGRHGLHHRRRGRVQACCGPCRRY